MDLSILQRGGPVARDAFALLRMETEDVPSSTSGKSCVVYK